MKLRKNRVQQPEAQWQKQTSTGKTKVKVSAAMTGMVATTGLKAGDCKPGHPHFPHC